MHEQLTIRHPLSHIQDGPPTDSRNRPREAMGIHQHSKDLVESPTPPIFGPATSEIESECSENNEREGNISRLESSERSLRRAER